VAGAGSATRWPPEGLLPHYDLVFAKGRCALEALAVGAAVVLCDASGLGPLVTAAELDGLRARNFGVRCPRARSTRRACWPRCRYDPTDAAEVARRPGGRRARRRLRRVVEVYEEARAPRRGRADRPRSRGAGGGGVLRAVSPGVRRHSGRELAREYERASREVVGWCNAAADERAARELLHAENARLRDALARAEHEADRLRQGLTEVDGCAAMRLRAWALRVPLVGRVGRSCCGAVGPGGTAPAGWRPA
jgi:hypothetical protein